MTNSITEIIQKHWIWWLLGLIVTVIGLTWNVAHELYVKPRDDEIKRLIRQISELEKSKTIPKTSEGKHDIQKEVISAKESHLTGSIQKGELFEQGMPYPLKNDKIKLGMHLSVMKNIYPSAEYDPGWETWKVKYSDGPFKFVNCSVETREDTADPRIIWLEYYFTDQESRKHVTDQALRVFGSETLKSKMLGEELEWPDIEGISVKIDPVRYILSKSQTE